MDGVFTHVLGIGHATQERIHAAGIDTWQAALEAIDAVPVRRNLRPRLREGLLECLRAHAEGDIGYFVRSFPRYEHWRLLREFHESLTYVDIETTGFGPRQAKITVIGAYHHGQMRHFVRGKNLDGFLDILLETKLLVSFNGSSFDVPHLVAHYHIPELPCPHVDLRHICTRLGFTGGLKNVAPQFGFRWGRDLGHLTGQDAIVLWSRWQTGDKRALELLIEYCRADVAALVAIVQHLVARWTGRGEPQPLGIALC